MKFKDMPKLPLVIMAAMFAVGAWAYPSLPAVIPWHWGPSGQIDAWAPKSLLSVFMIPLLGIALYALMWVAPYLDPKRANLMNSKRYYGLIIDLVFGLLAVVFAATLLSAGNHAFPVAKIIEVAVGMMFVVLGNYMGRVQRNWTMGVRFGWTLSDDVVWKKTNRLGGRLLVATGVLTILGAALPGVWAMVPMLVGIVALVPVTYVYSMVLYKRRHPDEMGYPGRRDRAADTDA